MRNLKLVEINKNDLMGNTLPMAFVSPLRYISTYLATSSVFYAQESRKAKQTTIWSAQDARKVKQTAILSAQDARKVKQTISWSNPELSIIINPFF